MKIAASMIGIGILIFCLLSPPGQIVRSQKSDGPPIDPAAGFFLQFKRGDIWPLVWIPYKTRTLQLKIGSCYECADLWLFDYSPPPWASQYSLNDQSKDPLPVGRWYATITSVAHDWQVHKRHYIFDVR